MSAGQWRFSDTLLRQPWEIHGARLVETRGEAIDNQVPGAGSSYDASIAK